MAVQDIQIRNSEGTFESVFPVPIEQGGTGATSASSAVSNLHLVTYDNSGSNSKMTSAMISQQSEADQPIRVHANGAAGNYLVYFTKSGTIGLWDVNAGSTAWSIRQWPVGSVYISFSSTSPATLFGGTWSQITGKFLYCTTNTNPGGSNTQTLSVANLPAHSHNAASGLNYIFKITNTNTWPTYDISIAKGGSANTWFHYTSAGTSVGSGTAHNNMPAYQGVYAWRRTA